MRGGLYAALIALNLDQADFDTGCDVRQVAAIKPLSFATKASHLAQSVEARGRYMKTAGVQ